MSRVVILVLLLISGCAVADTSSNLLDPLTVARTGKPNDSLICPAGDAPACTARPDREAPRLSATPEAVLDAWRRAIQAAPRTRLTHDANGLIVGEQKSRVFRFTDRFAVRAVAAGDGASYAAYSRSLAGRYDFGVNKKRLDGWAEAVDAELSRVKSAAP